MSCVFLLVRQVKSSGGIRFTIPPYAGLPPLGEGLAEVIYQVHNDPGGDLPSWLVNTVAVSQPYNTMLNMRKLVEESKYKEARFEFIRN